jgi:hypothetical protein
MGDASPRESGPSDADAVLERLMVRQDQVQPALAGADDDGARRLPSVKRNGLSCDRTRDRLQFGIERIGEDRRASRGQKYARQHGGANQIAAHNFPQQDDQTKEFPRAAPRFGATQPWRNYGASEVRRNALWPDGNHELVNCGKLWRRRHIGAKLARAIAVAAMAMKSGLTLTELEERIAGVRENLRELSEQAAADSGAGDEDLNAARIAEQEKELAELIERREALLRK